ncbi:hypothetical protein B6E66_00360 [Streptomyces maremycinicus]|nr:hypothetical protein B6E66_00360 [Streptomyces sp. B9173]
MESSIVIALIAAGSALTGIYAGVHAEAVKRKQLRKQRREEESEARVAAYNDRIVLLMCKIRVASRRQVERLTELQEHIESAHSGPSRQQVRSVSELMRASMSSQTDVALHVGLTCPPVRDRWFEFLDLRTRYVDRVEEFTHEADPGRRRELRTLLDRLAAARRDLVKEMKTAAEGLGRPLLIRDTDVDEADDAGAS